MSLTLDYLNKNVRRVIYISVIWKQSKSTKHIIQCHNCQLWGHATTNCMRPPCCLKYARDHHLRTCTKNQNTAAACANCGGEHTANYTKSRFYTERLDTLKECRNKAKYIPANVWDHWRPRPSARKDFIALLKVKNIN